MGINGLWKLLKERYEHIFKRIAQTELYGKKMAIDVGNWYYILRSAAYKSVVYSKNVLIHDVTDSEVDEKWLELILKSLIAWINKGITPILVYDGIAPEQKRETRKKRLDDKQKVRTRLDKLLESKPKDNDRQYLNEVRKLMCQLSYIPYESMELAKNFFSSLGIPTLEDIGTGRRL